MTSIRVLAAAGLLALSACGGGDDASETTVEVVETTDAAAEQSVSVTVPDDWYEGGPNEDFAYQYLWEGNNWDDILAQDFDTTDFIFSADFFVGLLEPTFAEKSTIEVRDENAELGGYPAIIIDIVYDSGSFTSLTYVDVDGHLWEFTVNSQTPEGLARGEEINQTATFSAD